MSRESRIAVIAGGTISVFLFIGCVLWDLLFPAYEMNPAWAPLFPGFALSPGGSLLGFIESAAYGALLGWLIVRVTAVVERAVQA